MSSSPSKVRLTFGAGSGLEPPRIAAVPNTVLEVLVEDPVLQPEMVREAMPLAQDASLESPWSSSTPASRRVHQPEPQSPSPSPPLSVSRPETKSTLPQYAAQASAEVDADYSGRFDTPDVVSGGAINGSHAHITFTTNACSQIHAYDVATKAAPTSPNPPSCTHSLQQLHFSAEDNINRFIGDITYTFAMAREGDVQAQVRLATAYKDGTDGLLQMYKMAIRWFLMAAEQGHAGAECEIGRLYETGRGVEEDHFTAVVWYRRAAYKGLAAAQKNLAVMYTQGWGVKMNHVETAHWYQRAADQGHSSAQFNLAILYIHGEGVPKDNARARGLFRMAAMQGHAKAQFKFGAMCFEGEGGPRDFPEAMTQFREAADRGHVEAQFLVGSMYSKGLGVRQDYERAVPWFYKAAEQGHAEAQSCLGVIYFKAKGVVQDLGEALKWFHKSAYQGHVPSMYNLGVMYNTGAYKNRTLALDWFLMAADGGYEGARDAYETLRAQRDSVWQQ
ncbi:hypothetical protein BGW39_003924 [Mortierella sp. 14UC]|nr:hypothetical protein BGW39_003924 [Mortierella sp. 14UC]